MVIQVRLFIGYLQNKEIKRHLNQSTKWKRAKVLGDSLLIETQWQDKDYIGLFIPSLMPYLHLKEKEQAIKTQLQFYCPKLNLDKHSVYLFSQIFLI